MSLLLVGRNVGLQSILSLIFNTGAILIAIAIHDKHPSTNLFILMSVAIIFSTIVTLLLVTGWHMRADYNSRYVIRHILCIGITQIIIQFTNGAGIKYETMSF